MQGPKHSATRWEKSRYTFLGNVDNWDAYHENNRIPGNNSDCFILQGPSSWDAVMFNDAKRFAETVDDGSFGSRERWARVYSMFERSLDPSISPNAT